MTVDVHHAETHLSELIAAAEAGEDVVIATGAGNAIKLVLAEKVSARHPFVFGRLKHALNLPEDWEEQWEAHGKELETLMCDAPFTTNGDE